MQKYAIGLILVLAFAVRAINLNSPVFGIATWRQADSAALARNYYDNGMRFLYPQIDWGGRAGYVETEFPVVPYGIALLYKLFGPYECYGRLFNITCSLLAIFFLFLLTKELMNEKTALWASFFYAVLPLNVAYSRSFQSESALLMSSVAGLYFFSKWLSSERVSDYILSLIFISLACLLKLPTLYLGLPLLYLAWFKFGGRTWKQISLWIYALVVFAAVAAWYIHAHRLFLQTGCTLFGIWGDQKADILDNIKYLLGADFWIRVPYYLFQRHFVNVFFPIFAIGLFVSRRHPREKFFDAWLLSVIVFIFLVGEKNAGHDYYQLPLILPASVYLAKVYVGYFRINDWQNKKSILLHLLLAVLLALSAERYYYYSIKLENPERSEPYQLALQIKTLVPADDLIVVVSNSCDPTILYLAHRKGWQTIIQTVDSSYLNGKHQNGARYVVGIDTYFEDIALKERLRVLLFDKYPAIFDNGKFFILKLKRFQRFNATL